jgi:alpha-galactosidase
MTLAPTDAGWRLSAQLGEGGIWQLDVAAEDGRLRLSVSLTGRGSTCDALGVRFGLVHNAARFLRNGYTSWDGSFFVEPLAAAEHAGIDPRLTEGYAMTGFVPATGGVAVAGFLRHDRFQSRIRFAYSDAPLSVSLETLIDRVPHNGRIAAEDIVLFWYDEAEEGLRAWARAVAEASPLKPRVPDERISGWCSWYNLYASLDDAVLMEHLEAMERFVETTGAKLSTFLVDDGFTPEMGDWLKIKPQFPDGMKPILQAAAHKGFVPGLWIAPFMVGNRSDLYAAHPDWVVRSRATGEPLAPMTFYGEFRWHKRSEAYYVLDITHPEAEAYIRSVFRTWRHDWGCRYFKTDFMFFGSVYGPEEARWNKSGLSRMQVWTKMARLIREEIGDAQWLLCGAPIWAPVGLADAVRIGRDVGVSWSGRNSAQSLLRDQTARNFANGILWQADPDCILLRERFHELTDEQVRSLALFAGLSGGVLMTSDNLDEVSDGRRALFARLASTSAAYRCDFPELGQAALRYERAENLDGAIMIEALAHPVLVQRVNSGESPLLNVFNTSSRSVDKMISWSVAGFMPGSGIEADPPSALLGADDQGIRLLLAPYQSVLITPAAARPAPRQ